jgi:hypothetical protein
MSHINLEQFFYINNKHYCSTSWESLAQHRKKLSCSFLHMAKKILRRDLGGIMPTLIAQWTGPGEAGSNIFPKFQTTDGIVF